MLIKIKIENGPFSPTVQWAMRRGQSLAVMPLVYIATSAASYSRVVSSRTEMRMNGINGYIYIKDSFDPG